MGEARRGTLLTVRNLGKLPGHYPLLQPIASFTVELRNTITLLLPVCFLLRVHLVRHQSYLDIVQMPIT